MRLSHSPAERAIFTGRRKEAYEALHPETRAGQAQALGMNAAQGHSVGDKLASTFTSDTAAKTGKSKRTIRGGPPRPHEGAGLSRGAVRPVLRCPAP